MYDRRAVLLDRLDLLVDEVSTLRALVAGAPATAPERPSKATTSAPPRAATTEPVVSDASEEELPPEPSSEPTIDPVQAAELVGVTRQTIDRRLKEASRSIPGGPVDISQGAVRSRWRWHSAADVRRWWAAVK